MSSHYSLILILIHVSEFTIGKREICFPMESVHTHTHLFFYLIKLFGSYQLPVLEHLLYRDVFSLLLLLLLLSRFSRVQLCATP